MDATLREMDAAGVDLALMSAWHAPSGPLIGNEDVAALVDRAPDRFRGLSIRWQISSAHGAAAPTPRR
ncbi:hypothetical protein [Nocardia lijiangensis]|uniref:hypothetical protein n=1 Tax=Nocardia lijiangensis TaxID=299618 RepID=UPI000A4D70E0|nr:hypothetical protein [Nocardia lijiangensis]